MQRRMPLTFIVESGTDVRLVRELALRYQLRVLARRINGGVEISHPSKAEFEFDIGPASRLVFFGYVLRRLNRIRAVDGQILVQGYGLAAFAANLVGRLFSIPVTMLVCSPAEEYYRCRIGANDPAKPFRRVELSLIRLLAMLNAMIGRHYVVLSQHLRSVVRAHGARCTIDVIPVYGVDTERFAPARGDKRTLDHSILFSSRIAPEKDAATLLRAVHILAAEGFPVRVIHRSGGFTEFIRLAEEIGVAMHVDASQALDPDDLPKLYQSVDVCVQASRSEGLGFSVLEALACETPAIAAAVGGLVETVRPGETGWTYSVGDARELANAIREVCNNPSEALRRARQGRQLVQDRFDMNRVFDNLQSALTFSPMANSQR